MTGNRLSVILPTSVKSDLDARAKSEGTSVTQRVSKALRLLNWWDDQPEETRYFVQRPGGDLVEVEFL